MNVNQVGMSTRLAVIVAVSCLCQSTSATSLRDKLGSIFAAGEAAGSEQILPPDEAFRLSARANRDNTISLNWDIEPGYYLYNDKFKVTALDDDHRLAPFTIPAGKLKQDLIFGAVRVHYDKLSVDVPVISAATATGATDIEVGYQGCKEDAVCYPPIQKTFNLNLFANAVAAPVFGDDLAAPKVKVSEQDAITQRLLSGGFIINLLSFFGFGLLLSLTPCVFPMIPILSGVIVGQQGALSTRRAFMLSLVFVLAMAASYALLGVIAGSFNINLQAASQNVWAIVLFSGVFVLLALSMFGFYELQLPGGWQTRLNAMSASQPGGSLKGAAIMGAVSAIVVGPCVAPPLAGALLYISQTGNALFGGMALFLMGLGFGVPLLIIGASAGGLLPRAGQWMNAVKQFFGVLMLGVAIWFLERVLPSTYTLLLWASLFIISAVYLGAFDKVDAASKWLRFRKGLGLVIMVYGVIMIFASVSGGNRVTGLLNVSSTPAASHAGFAYVGNETELERSLAEAGRAQKPVMLVFYADWCVVCNELERYTFPDENVRALLSELVLLKADVTQNNDQDQALLTRFDLFGPPGLIFFNRDTEELSPYRLVGFIDAESFAAHLQEVIAL